MEIHWRQKIYVAYLRSKDHPMKLRLANWFRRILFLDKVMARTSFNSLMYLNIDDFVQFQILLHGAYETETIKLLSKLLKDAKCFLDVGGHVGQYSLAAVQFMSQDGLAIVIEPNPRTFTYLLQNIELNQYKNIVPILGAVSNRSGTIQMQVPPEFNWGLSKECSNSNDDYTYKVCSFKLDQLLNDINIHSIDVMKIDVEGYELRILQDVFESNSPRPKNIIFEFYPNLLENPFEIINLLKREGYSLYNILGQSYDEEDVIPEHNLWACKN